MPLRYWLLIILLGAVWGSSFLFNAVLIRELSPLWVSAGRVSIGAAICWVYFVATRKSLPRDRRLYPQLLVLGILNYAIPFSLFPFAEHTVASSIVGVINGLTPMSTVIVSQLWPGGEKATWNKLAGVVIGFLGAVILALPSLGAGASAQITGLLAALLATICYAVTLNYARRFKAIEPAVVATCSLTGAALVSLPIALIFSGLPIITRLETWGRSLPSPPSRRASASSSSIGCCPVSARPTSRSTPTSRRSRPSCSACWCCMSASSRCISWASPSSSSASSSWMGGW